MTRLTSERWLTHGDKAAPKRCCCASGTTCRRSPVTAPTPGAAPELAGQVVTRPGDIWLLGCHRIMCGDCTQPEAVKALLGDDTPNATFTDPPYCSGGFQEAGRSSGSIGVRADTATRTERPEIANDKLSTRGYIAMIKAMLSLVPSPMLYMFTDWRMWNVAYDVSESSGYGVRNMIVWDKGSPGMGRGWRTQHELLLFGASKPVNFSPTKALGNVIKSKRTGNPLHPTQKPVDLLVQVLDVSDMAKTIYEPFCGSGSTLMACEATGRRCLGMEVSPGFVDVIVRRWEGQTQKRAILAGGQSSFSEEAVLRAA